jgi:hypothetical protein
VITRRHFLGRGITGAGLLFLPPWLTRCASLSEGSLLGAAGEESPIQRFGLSESKITGEDPHSAHKTFWNLSELAQKISETKSQESTDLAIIGGGMSGLLSAYELRRFSPIVLEAGPRFGGLSRGESFGNCDYSIGAAYLVKPSPDSDAFRLLGELSLIEMLRPIDADGAVALDGEMLSGFWKGDTDPKNRHQFRRVAKYLKETAPEIPYRTKLQKKQVHLLDQEDLFTHLRKKTGPLHPHVEKFLTAYCASSLNGTGNEISAAAALNFLCVEFGDTCALPAGNSTITEALYKRLRSELPKESLRASSPVVQIKVEKNEVLVTYIDVKGAFHKIRAKTAIVACPKFVASKILAEIEPERADAIAKVEYRAYAVGNVCLKRRTGGKEYDRIFLNGSSPTDVVEANYTQPSSEQGVLTFYYPLPKTGGRAELFSDTDMKNVRQVIEGELDLVLSSYGLNRKDVAEIRLARWGHALPVPKKGIFRSGVLEKIQKPFREHVFFVEQDNWALPAFETALSEVMFTKSKIQESISRLRQVTVKG